MEFNFLSIFLVFISFHIFWYHWIVISSLQLPHFFKAIKNFLPSAFHCFSSCWDHSVIKARSKSTVTSQDYQIPIILSILHKFSALQFLIQTHKEIMSISLILNDHWLTCPPSLFMLLQVRLIFSVTEHHQGTTLPLTSCMLALFCLQSTQVTFHPSPVHTLFKKSHQKPLLLQSFPTQPSCGVFGGGVVTSHTAQLFSKMVNPKLLRGWSPDIIY